MSNGQRLLCTWCLYVIAGLMLCLVILPAWSLGVYADSQQVRAAVLRDWPPQYQVDDSGRPNGFAIDIIESIAASNNFVHSKKYAKIYSKWYAQPKPSWTTKIVMLVMIGLIIIFTLWHNFRVTKVNLRLNQSITDQKYAEAALRASEEKYRLIVENQSVLTIKMDADGRLQFVSPSFYEAFGNAKDAEVQLKQSEEKFKAIFEEAADAVVLINKRTFFVADFNAVAHQSLGYSKEEFVRINLKDLIVPDPPDTIATVIERIMSIQDHPVEVKLRDKSGQARYFLMKHRLLFVNGCKFILCIWHDITKKAHEGTGMGLSIVHGIVRRHNGAVDVESYLGKGTVFRVFLPLSKEPRSTKADAVEQRIRGNESILLVDDEPALAKLGCDCLKQLGYRVQAFNSSPDALAAFKANPSSFDLVITDMTMPKMTGKALIKQILKSRPGLPVILCSGHHSKADEKSLASLGIKAFLKKPYRMKTLANTIRQALAEKILH